MKIVVLFDGAGLARLGLEQAGHECVGVELNPVKHYLSTLVGSGNSVLGDATKFDVSRFDAVWASPPCAQRSTAIKDLTGRGGYRNLKYQGDWLDFSLKIKNKILWVENVTKQGSRGNDWGTVYNAAQFLKIPIQNRNRIVGGRYDVPKMFRPYKRWVPGLCPAVSATEYKGCATDRLRASRFYGRKLTIQECAYYQGFKIPRKWAQIPDWFMSDYKYRNVHWERALYEAIGDGVPVYMAKAFGKVYYTTV